MDSRLKSRMAACVCALLAVAPPCRGQSVLTYHGEADRSGNFVIAVADLGARPLHRISTRTFIPALPVISMPSRSIGSRRDRAPGC